ncbi:amidase [Ornithinimicrobium pratense]|uniref:Amidase n=1 Tax=Ornithinimicrobium pratense TaxID=2593973 RepID=A0A5J6V827_9MICO|nr:amidase family protein [Ornithinimicrobium pratense]QFG69494.1 amidase [Ornithinimicrobium pratense]
MTEDEIIHADAWELAAAVRSGRLDPVEVTTAHLNRIEAVNPAVNAIVDLRPEQALDRARELSSLPRHELEALPLAGLPVAVKDMIPAAGFRHTQGSLVFADRVATEDHVVVARMRAAGAVVVGKTNTPEFSLGSHTFNSVYGLTRNPYDLNCSAGGSSGGAAAALAARMLPIADGSDTGGSLRNPASFCNVTALRPSLGSVPNVPSSYPFGTLSVKGPMGRTVRDVALLMSVLAGGDGRDPLTCAGAPGGYLDLTGPTEAASLHLAWTPDLGGLVPVDLRVRRVLGEVVDRIAGSGAAVVEDYPDLRQAASAFRTLRGIQMLANLGSVDEAHPGRLKEDARGDIQVGREATGPQVAQALVDQGEAFHRMRRLLEHYDALLLPTVQVAPFPVEQRYPSQIEGREMRDYLEWMTLLSSITMTGHPSVSVPVGFTEDGLPIGLQIVGRNRQEAALLRIAQFVEDLCGTSDVVSTQDLTTERDPFPAIA